MTGRQLHEYSVEHLHYELSMLRETVAKIGPEETERDRVVRRNALIESFAIHGRVVALFLTQNTVGGFAASP